VTCCLDEALAEAGGHVPTRRAFYPCESEVCVGLLNVLSQASIAALLSMLIALFPIAAGLAYVLSPSEQRLAMVRPISLAALFSGLAGLMLGFINVLSGFWIGEGEVNWRSVAVGAAESLVPLTLAFGALTFAWLCVSVGMRRKA
jgi:hypothetical protein